MASTPTAADIIKWMREFETKFNGLADVVDGLRADRGGNGGAPDRSRLLKGSWWNCEGCGARLGVVEAGALRIKAERGEVRIIVVPGRGGETRITCRTCVRENVLKDDPNTPTG